MHDRLWVVAVDVEDRRLDALGDVGAVVRGARRARVRREADHVVDDDVHRPADRVRRKIGELHHLRDDALPGERCVAVQQHGHDLPLVVVPDQELLGPRLACDHRVDRLKVRRVRREVHVHCLLTKLHLHGPRAVSSTSTGAPRGESRICTHIQAAICTAALSRGLRDVLNRPIECSPSPRKWGGAHRRCARRIARIIRRGARRWPTGRAPKGGYPPRKTLNDDRGGGAEIQRGARVGRVPVSTSRGGT